MNDRPLNYNWKKHRYPKVAKILMETPLSRIIFELNWRLEKVDPDRLHQFSRKVEALMDITVGTWNKLRESNFPVSLFGWNLDELKDPSNHYFYIAELFKFYGNNLLDYSELMLIIKAKGIVPLITVCLCKKSKLKMTGLVIGKYLFRKL